MAQLRCEACGTMTEELLLTTSSSLSYMECPTCGEKVGDTEVEEDWDYEVSAKWERILRRTRREEEE